MLYSQGLFKSNRIGVETYKFFDAHRFYKDSNRTVSGLKPTFGNPYLAFRATFKSNRIGVETAICR